MDGLQKNWKFDRLIFLYVSHVKRIIHLLSRSWTSGKFIWNYVFEIMCLGVYEFLQIQVISVNLSEIIPKKQNNCKICEVPEMCNV